MSDTVDAGIGELDVRAVGRQVGGASRWALKPAAGDLLVVQYGEMKKERKEGERDGAP